MLYRSRKEQPLRGIVQIVFELRNNFLADTVGVFQAQTSSALENRSIVPCADGGQMVLLGAASSTRADGEGLAGSGSSGHTNDGFQEEHIRHRAGDLVDGLHQRDSGVAADRLGRHGLGPNADTTAVASITQLVGRGAGQASAADRELQQVGRDGSDRGGLGTAGVTADHGGGFGADNAAQFVRHEALMQGGVVDLQRSGVQAQSQLRLLIQVERCEEAEVGGSAGNQGVGPCLRGLRATELPYAYDTRRYQQRSRRRSQPAAGLP